MWPRPFCWNDCSSPVTPPGRLSMIASTCVTTDAAGLALPPAGCELSALVRLSSIPMVVPLLALQRRGCRRKRIAQAAHGRLNGPG